MPLKCLYLTAIIVDAVHLYRVMHMQRLRVAEYLLARCPSGNAPVLFRNGSMDRADLQQTLPSACPTLCYEGICESPKVRVLPSETLSQTPIFLLFSPQHFSFLQVLST